MPSWNITALWDGWILPTKDFYHNLDSNTAPLTARHPQALVHCGVQARTSANQCRWAGRCTCNFGNTWQNGNTITRNLTYETSGLRTNEISLAHRALQGKFPLWDDGSSPVECTMNLIAAMRWSNMHVASIRGTSFWTIIVEISYIRADSNELVICAPMIWT